MERMHSGEIRLVKAAKRTFRAEAMLVLFTILITSWSMFALYKISTGWDGNISTLFGFGSVAIATTLNNANTKGTSNENINQDDKRKVLMLENQHIVPETHYATGQATVLTDDMAQRRLIPNLAELIDANQQLDDEDASTMETGKIDGDDKQASGSDNHPVSDVLLDDSKLRNTKAMQHTRISQESLLENMKNRRKELATLLALEDHRLAELDNLNNLKRKNIDATRYHDLAKKKSNSRDAKFNEEKQQHQDSDNVDDNSNQSVRKISDNSGDVDADMNENVNGANDQNDSQSDDSDESSARQTGLLIDEEVEKLTNPGLEFSNQEEDSEYGNEAVRFDDNPNTSANQDQQQTANKNRSRHEVKADEVTDPGSTTTSTTSSTTTTTTTPKPSIRSSPQYIVQFADKTPNQQPSTSQDLNMDHNKPAVSLINHLLPQQRHSHTILRSPRRPIIQRA